MDRASRARIRVEVTGIVQGVGFRPFVHSLATLLRLSGSVRNDSRGVVIEIEGAPGQLEAFLVKLQSEAPPFAVIEHVTSAAIAATGEHGFAIVGSIAGEGRSVLISPDIATRNECVGEIFRSSESPLLIPVQQLHELRAAFHDRSRRAVRPAANDDGRLRHVRGLFAGVSRPGRQALSCATDLMSAMRAKIYSR